MYVIILKTLKKYTGISDKRMIKLLILFKIYKLGNVIYYFIGKHEYFTNRLMTLTYVFFLNCFSLS